MREKRARRLEADVTVMIRGGLYRLDEAVEFGPGDETVTPSDETVQRLRALGYVE